MNSIIKTCGEREYHTFANVEFTGVFDRTVYKYDNIYGFGGDPHPRYGHGGEYHLFIRYGDKVYMDVKCVGDIVMSFAELLQNRYWKYHYDLSLLLTNDKNMVIHHDIEYNRKYLEQQMYEEKRLWSIDTAFIESDIKNHTKKIITRDDVCYYKINPYDMDNMEYASYDALNTFQSLYMEKRKLRNQSFDERSAVYKNLLIDNLITIGDKKC
jgi:hypothetical protein